MSAAKSAGSSGLTQGGRGQNHVLTGSRHTGHKKTQQFFAVDMLDDHGDFLTLWRRQGAAGADLNGRPREASLLFGNRGCISSPAEDLIRPHPRVSGRPGVSFLATRVGREVTRLLLLPTSVCWPPLLSVRETIPTRRVPGPPPALLPLKYQ